MGSAMATVDSDLSCDVLVVGGGVNGTGIARDAAGRGLSVVLCEQDDLASHTSSNSTKLVHGGLRYLEHYEFRLVRSALGERELLLDAAPHIMWPLRFVMPHAPHLRPMWLLRAGLFLYDNLARRRRLAGSSAIDFRNHPAGRPLRDTFRRGFVYSDGWVDDARLVTLCAVDAAERGATVLTRTRCQSLAAVDGRWQATLVDRAGRKTRVMARAVVNAAGPWAASFAGSIAPGPARHRMRLVKGSHVVVPRIFDHPFAYIFQNEDRRIIFAIPYEGDFTLIGTTDVDYDAEPSAVSIQPAEIDYLCANASRYFKRPVRAKDVVWTYAGVRPLLDDESSDASEVTRDYVLELENGQSPPLLSVFGGKITTFRKLAEEAVNRLAPLLGSNAPPWTVHTVLPGGDLPGRDYDTFVKQLAASHAWLPEGLRRRYARAYGTRIDMLLGTATSLAELGEEVLPGLHVAEIRYLQDREWAMTAHDILWRRSKLGLHVPAGSEARLDDWLRAHRTKED